MSIPNLLLAKLLRRSRSTTILSSLYSLSSSHSFSSESQSLTNTYSRTRIAPALHSFAAHNLSSFRSFSTRESVHGVTEFDADSAAIQSELSGSGPGFGGSEIAEAVVSAAGGEPSIIPVRALVALLDGYHDFTGLPWWAVIASSTLALRLALLPVLILQLKKLKIISEMFPKLPPPFPPPLSGRSFKQQFSLFLKDRRALGCPSYLWFLAYFSIQFPCFLLWMTSIRRMSLDHHSGFDSGGALWFQNLTELPHGVLGPIFPFLIAGLHFVNIQISFRTSSVGNEAGLFGLLAQYYKTYLDIMTLPILFVTFCIPQGSLVYWLTNSSLTLVQQLSLNHPDLRKKLGLPDRKSPLATSSPGKMSNFGVAMVDSPTPQRKVSVENLMPQELLALSIQFLAKEDKDRAISLLRLALVKDPEYVRALVVMGQTLLQKKMLSEAVEYFECAISKLFLVGPPTEVEDVDLLILASQWAGVACIRQGKNVEGIAHLERIASLEEPEDPKSKDHYFDGLVLLASALYNEGRKAEATQYLRTAAAYNPAYKEYLEQCENDDDNFVSDLVSSRRRDY